MDTYEAITYSLYTNTKDLSYKNGRGYIVKLPLFFVRVAYLYILILSYRGIAL